jgi:hypothetical protein
MNMKAFKQALPFLLRNKIVPFLWGSQGIGKTQTLYQYCRENDLQLVTLHTATQDVGDLIGLLVKGEDGTVHHARPGWLPTEGNGIIFLDELNRAAPDVIQAMFPFVTEGRLHRHILPEGWRVVAAGNYNSDRFMVTDTSDAAWLSRFCHIDFTPTTEEWTVFADSRGMTDIADFIRAQPSMLELTTKDAGRLDTSFIVPDRRAWTEGVGKLDAEDLPVEITYDLYAGLIGTAAAAAYLSWKAKGQRSLSLDQILHRYPGEIQKRVKELSGNDNEKRFDVLNQPIDELFVKLDMTPELLSQTKTLDNLKAYLLDIPKELSMKAFSKMVTMKAFTGRQDLINDPAYVAKFS